MQDNKKKVLFVDDDPELINGLKRSMYVLRRNWEVEFAGSGEEAVKILDQSDFDVVVTDLRMPGMNGVSLLKKIKETKPHILRVILSGQIDEANSIKATNLAHQFISKPSSTEVIRETIEHAGHIHSGIINTEMIRLINGIGELPGLPEIYLKIEKLLQSDNATFDKIAKLVSSDLSLAAKILQVVNSGFFGLKMRITDLMQALSFIGLNTLKAIILHISVFSTAGQSGKKIHFIKKVASESLNGGILAKKIAARYTNDREIIDDSFTAGILQDTGKLILAMQDEFPENAEMKARESKKFVWEAETEIYGYNHADAGAYLLSTWGIPNSIVEAAAFHHKPSMQYSDKFTTVTAVHISNGIIHSESVDEEPNILGRETLKEFYPEIDFDYLEKLNLIGKIPEIVDEYNNMSGVY
jgi:HD-like signal output (HDOD) protein/ActR/RegA family two-component response regulator